jgi:MFS family permease
MIRNWAKTTGPDRRAILITGAASGNSAQTGNAPFYGWRVVAVGFVTATVAWSLGLFGASVYLKAVTAAHGWSVSLVSGAVTGFYIVSAFAAAAVGSGIDRLGARPILIGGTFALSLGVASIGMVSAPWQIYVAFLVMGIGWSCLSVTGLTATIAPWFERHQGRAITLVLTGASAGSMIGVPALLFGIDRLGLAHAMFAAAVLAIAILLPLHAIVLRHRRPEDVGQHRDGDGAPSTPAAVEPLGRRWHRDDAVRTAAFWSVAVAFALALMIQIGFLTHHVNFAAATLGATGAGLLVGATGFTALLGRLLLAKIVDRVDVRRLSSGLLLLHALSLGAMSLWPGAVVLIAGSLVYGFALGQITTLSPVILRREFGAASFGAIYGTAATVIQLISSFGPVLYGVLRDAFGGYGPGLAVAATVDLVAMIIVLAARRPPPLKPR